MIRRPKHPWEMCSEFVPSTQSVAIAFRRYSQPEVLHLRCSLAVPANAEGTVSDSQPHSEHRVRTRRKRAHGGMVSGESPHAVVSDRERGREVSLELGLKD